MKSAEPRYELIESTEMKKPKDLPQIGDRVELKGRGIFGILQNVDTENYWSAVKWDMNGPGPMICHLHELKKVA